MLLHAPSSTSTMTLGLEERKLAGKSSPPTTTTTTTTPSATASKNSKSKASAMLPSSSGKPKTILSCSCSELNGYGSSLKVLHSVQLHLTSYNEILVLKRGDKSRTQTVLRRHGVGSEIIEEHPILPSALLVKVPNTLLTYVYQLDKEKTLKQWMNKIESCRKKMISNGINGYFIPGGGKNGVVKDKSSITTATINTTLNNPATPTVSTITTLHGGGSGGGGGGCLVPPNSKTPTNSVAYSYAPGPDHPVSCSYVRRPPPGSNGGDVRPVSCYLSGPGSPVMRMNESRSFLVENVATSNSSSINSNGDHSNKVDGPIRGDGGMAVQKGVCPNSLVLNVSKLMQHDSDTNDVLMREDINSANAELNRGDCTNTELNRTDTELYRDDSEISRDDSELNQDDSTNTEFDSTNTELMRDDSTASIPITSPISLDQVTLSLEHGSPSSLTTFSRSSSARSSGRSGGSTRMLNLSALEESLELTTNQIVRQKKKSDSLSLDRNMSLNLCLDDNGDGRRGFVRRASDQFLGIIKMRSLREKESRKMMYVKRACSSASELDTMATTPGDISAFELDTMATTPGTAEYSSVLRGETTPTYPTIVTPTSPLRTTSPSLPHTTTTITNTSENTSGNENESSEEFIVSRFHHTQIRNRKWKQSPRIQRNISVQSNAESTRNKETWSMESRASSSSYARSMSESPTAASGRSIYGKECRGMLPSDTLPNRSAGAGYAIPPSQSSTLPRSMKGRRRRLHSEQGGGGGGTTPNSPVPSSRHMHLGGGGGGVGAGKSPKLLRIFHRRGTSGSIKLPSDFSDVTHRGSVDSDISSSFHLEHSFSKDAMPRKLHHFPAKDVAMELTLVDSGLLRNIRPEELVDGAWIKKETKEEKAVNVLRMVRSFNQLALLVPTEILNETTPHARAKVVSAFIQIARRCYSLHNYNSLKAVLAGLQCTPIYRLKRTWKELTSKRRKQFDQLCALMSESENWEQYRNEITNLITSRTSFIPFLGMFLTQVVQNDSYHQIRQTSGSKVITNDHSTSYSDHTSTDQINSSSLTMKMRRRSASLGDCSSLVPLTPSAINPSLPSDNQDYNVINQNQCSLETGGVSPDDDEQVFLDDSFLSTGPLGDHMDDHLINENQRNGDSDSFYSHSDHTHPTVAIEIVDEDDTLSYPISYVPSDGGLLEHYDFHSELSNKDMKGEGPGIEGEELNLEDISFGFKRRSLSFESLLDSYKEDEGLQRVLHSSLAQLAGMSSSMQSLTDEECSDHELYESSLLETTTSDCWSCDLESSSLSCSYNSSHLDMDPQSSHLDMDPRSNDSSFLMDPRPQSHLHISSRNKSRSMDDGRCEVSVVTPPISMMTPLKFMPPDMCPISAQVSSTPLCQDAPPEKGGVAHRQGETKLSSPIKRSKSQNSKILRRSKNKVFLRKSKLAPPPSAIPTVAVTPTDMLIQFQIASMGCVMGVESKEGLRAVLKDSDTNSEKDNYVISHDREKEVM